MKAVAFLKKTLFIVFLLAVGLIAGESINELETKLETASGVEKVEILNKISRRNRLKTDYKKALQYAEASLRTAEIAGDKKIIAISLNNLGVVYSQLNNYQWALDCFRRSYRLGEETGDRGAVADSLNNIGNIHSFMSQNAKALDVHLRALALRKELGDKQKIALSLTNAGSVYANLGNYHKALEYHLDALALYEALEDRRRTANSLNNIGSVYGELGVYDRALYYFLESLEIKEKFENYERGISSTLINIGRIHGEQEHYPGALDCFRRALKMKEIIGDKRGICTCYNCIGMVYDNLGDYTTASGYFRKSLAITENTGDKRGVIDSLTSLGGVYAKRNRYKHALTCFKKALIPAKEIDAKRKLETIYKNLASLYAAKGDYKNAYNYHLEYSGIKDTVYNEKNSEKIAEMQARCDSRKKEKEIELLKKDKHILEKNSKIQKMTGYAFLIGLILMAAAAGLLLKKFLYLFSFWKKQKFIGGYRLLEKIGAGGMGTVYKAHSVRNKSKKFAVKLLREELFHKEICRKRFEREANIIDRLNHPNIITVFERGQRKQTLFMVMEWVRGKTLRVKLDEEGNIELKQALPILIQVTGALHSIHRRDIVHRDLKPGNIMLIRKDGNPNFVKLLDFGLAKTISHTRLTESGILVGTVSYMSPQQLSGSGGTPACDVYSLGVIMYETVTGKKPFHGETTTDIMRQVLRTLPVEPLRLNPRIPPRLNHLIMEMMEKEAEKRPGTGEVLERLEGVSLKTYGGQQ